MKKLLLGVFIFLVGATYAQDKLLSFSNGYVNSGKFKVTKSVTEGDSYIDVTYNFTGAYMYNQVENGKTYARIEMPDARVLDIKGEPALPYYNDLLAITSSENVSVSIVKSSYKEYSVSKVLPSPGPIPGDAVTYEISESKVYSSNSLYPATTAKIEAVNFYKTVPFAQVAIYPLQYNPVANKIRCYSSITYRLKYKDADVSKSLKSSTESLYSLKSAVTNPKILDKFGEESSALRASYSYYDYVIVTTNKYAAAAKKMSDWKTMCGYRCTTLARASWDTTTAVKNALRNIYATHIPDYLLIIGDYEDVPAKYETVRHARTDEYKIVHMYSDNAYACADDRDYVEDVAKGRISVTTASEALTVVDKIINYEKNPTTNSSFYNKILSVGYFQDNQDRDDKGNITRDYDGYEDMSFISAAETINKNLISKAYTVDRHYVRNTGISVCPRSSYLPNEFKNCSSAWNKGQSNIINAINDGRVIVHFLCHGLEDGLYGHYTNEKIFNNNNINSLSNGNKLPVFFNFACLTSTFAKNTCFSELLIRKSNGGAVGVFGNSQVGWDWEGASSAKNIFTALYDEKIRSIGDAISRGLVLMGSSSSYHEHSHKSGHYFGDPSMEIWTDVPTCLSPTITKEGSSIRVKTGGVSGCKVTICRISDMTILNTTTMSGSEGLFNVGNAPCYVTITKHNYIPYVGVVRDLYLQNMSFTEDRTIHGVNITAGKNVTSDLTQGNVYVKSGNTTLLATSSVKLKSGFSVKSGAKLSVKIQARPCNYSGNGPRSLRSADIDLEYDDEEFEINPEITDLDDAISDAEKINIYPNPTDGLLYINVSNSIINDIVVTDISGQVYINETVNTDQTEIDLSSYPKGIYLVNIVTENDSYTKKIVLK